MSVWFNCGNRLGVEKIWLGAKSDRFHNSQAKPCNTASKIQQEKLSRGFTVWLPVLLTLDPLTSPYDCTVIKQITFFADNTWNFYLNARLQNSWTVAGAGYARYYDPKPPHFTRFKVRHFSNFIY